MSVSVIIPTKDRPNELTKCINSILMQAIKPKEVITVDASENELTRQKIESMRTPAELDINFIYIHTKPELTKQRNFGVKASSGNVIIFLDDDVVLGETYIEEMVKVFEYDLNNKIIGATGNIVNDTPDPWWRIGRIINRIFFLPSCGNGKFRLSGLPSFLCSNQEIAYVECLSGCNMAFRKLVFKEFEFDENLRGYCFMEDQDFSYRVSRKYRLAYVPKAHLVHNSAMTERDTYKFKRMLVNNHYYLFIKNNPKSIRNYIAFTLSLIGLILNQLKRASIDGVSGVIAGIRDMLTCKNND